MTATRGRRPHRRRLLSIKSWRVKAKAVCTRSQSNRPCFGVARFARLDRNGKIRASMSAQTLQLPEGAKEPDARPPHMTS